VGERVDLALERVAIVVVERVEPREISWP